jgi:hypothetical protein
MDAQRMGGFNGSGSDIKPVEVIGNKGVPRTDHCLIASQRR